MSKHAQLYHEQITRDVRARQWRWWCFCELWRCIGYTASLDDLAFLTWPDVVEFQAIQAQIGNPLVLECRILPGVIFVPKSVIYTDGL